MLRFFASSTCDFVDWIRKGLASFSDCAQPIVSFVRSILPMPRSEPLQIGPYWASTPAGTAAVRSVVPPAAEIAFGTAPPAAGADPDGAGAAAVVAAGAGALDAAGAAAFLDEQPAARTVSPTTARVVMRRGADMPCLPLECGPQLRARSYMKRPADPVKGPAGASCSWRACSFGRASVNSCTVQ